MASNLLMEDLVLKWKEFSDCDFSNLQSDKLKKPHSSQFNIQLKKSLKKHIEV